MNKNELCKQLRTPFKNYSQGGLKKTSDERWKNIYFVVPPSPPIEIKAELPVKVLAEANRTLNSLPIYKEMDDLDKLINFLFVRREAVQSSRLEGTWSTIDHALTPSSIVAEGKGKNEHQAVRGYAAALEKIIELAAIKKEKIFTQKLISEIHKNIVKNDPQSTGIPGKLRTPKEPGSIVTIGGLNRPEESIYNPAPPEDVATCLQNFIEWLANEELAQKGDAGVGMNLPIRLAVAHAHFEAIHPFTDGNGRTGRSLWPLQMVASGHMPIYLSGYVEINKRDYSLSLQEAQKKLNYIPLITFICNAIIESALETKKTKEAIWQLPLIWQKRALFRKNSTAERALKLLLRMPIISTEVLKDELDISNQAATTAINQLVERKIVKYRQTENRKRIYACEELIAILSRPFGSDIEVAIEKAATST